MRFFGAENEKENEIRSASNWDSHGDSNWDSCGYGMGMGIEMPSHGSPAVLAARDLRALSADRRETLQHGRKCVHLDNVVPKFGGLSPPQKKMWAYSIIDFVSFLPPPSEGGNTVIFDWWKS